MLKNLFYFSDQPKHMVIPSVVNCARQYVLIKIHKPTFVFCLIVSNISSASYKFAHFLSQSLAHLTCNKLYIVKTSYNFVDKLKLISSSNYTMLSLDVKSIFTNVPIQVPLDCLEERLCESIEVLIPILFY